VLTQIGDWHLIFLINLPIGLIAIACARPLLPSIPGSGLRRGVDFGGALTITAAPILAVYGILSASESGWGSSVVIGCLALALAILTAFVMIERNVSAPMVPLRIFRSPAISISNVAMVFMMAAFFAWFFFTPLYMQRVLGFDSLQTGLGFLPAMLMFGAMSSGIAAKIVGHYGPKPSMLAGMSLVVIGLALLARTRDRRRPWLPSSDLDRRGRRAAGGQRLGLRSSQHLADGGRSDRPRHPRDDRGGANVSAERRRRG
jgi:predicted MFS family arabinose efflux permease